MIGIIVVLIFVIACLITMLLEYKHLLNEKGIDKDLKNK